MHMCPICKNSVVVDPSTGKLMTHGPETFTGDYTVCSGSGIQVEEPEKKEEILP